MLSERSIETLHVTNTSNVFVGNNITFETCNENEKKRLNNDRQLAIRTNNSKITNLENQKQKQGKEQNGKPAIASSFQRVLRGVKCDDHGDFW